MIQSAIKYQMCIIMVFMMIGPGVRECGQTNRHSTQFKKLAFSIPREYYGF